MITRPLLILFLFLIPLVITGGCAGEKKIGQSPGAIEQLAEENIDSSCAYFYFLWGSHAEYNQQFEEALEAYQKASICDPTAEYIAEKIPILLIQTRQMTEATVWLENYLRTHPHKTAQRFMLARLKIQDNRADEAILLYKEALELEPENNSIRLRLGLLYSKQKQYEAAEEILKSILQTDKDSYFALLYLARLYTQTGELNQAANYFNKALERNWSKELTTEIAEFYNLQKEFEKALALYRNIVEKDIEDERAALGLVQTLLFLERKKEALEELSSIRDFSNTPERIDLIRSQIYVNSGELEKARELLESILKKTPLVQASYLLGVIYFEEKEMGKSLALLQKIPATAVKYNDSVLLRIRILEETNRHNQAISLLKKVISSEKTRTPLFYSLLSSIYQHNDRQEDALTTLAEATEAYQEDQQILYEYALLLEKNNIHEKAFSLMEKILSLNPDHADALNFIGYTLADKNTNLEQAFEYIEKALQLKPNSGYIQDSLGWVYFRLGKFERARIELEKAIELEPSDPYIYDHLGDTYRALNNDDMALFFYKKAIEILENEQKKLAIQEKIHELDK